MASDLPAGVGRDTPVAVRSATMWQNGIAVYGLYADGTIAGDGVNDATVSRRTQLGSVIELRLPARAAPLKRLLWRIDGAANLRGILVGARIATPLDSERANLLMVAVYAGFVGLCLALVIYNLAMWFALRHDFQLVYCLMVVSLLVYAMSSSAALAWIWPDLLGTTRLRINYEFLGFAATGAVLFARTFFEPELFKGRMGHFAYVVCGLLVLASTMFALFAPWHVRLLNHFFSAAFLVMLALVPAIIWRAVVRRSNYLWVFCVAWALPVAFAALRVANNMNYIGWSFWIDNSTILSMTSEALLSSLAIVYRLRLLSQERDEARIQELAARALADTDPLTGLLNRRAFLRHAIGRDGPQMLLILDIDHFKAVNETIGHDGGDEVLRLVARALRAAAPVDALIARIGGEEFALIMHDHSRVEGEDVLSHLRATRMPFDLTVTASIGCCVGPLTSEAEWKRLYRCADRALYDAKAAGRDRSRTSQHALAA